MGTFAGKDATKEFDMIHPAGVVEKHAPYAVIGKLRSEGAQEGSAIATAGGGSSVANHHAWGEYDGHNWRMEGLEHNPGALIINFDAYIGATIHLLYAVCGSVLRTIFSPKVFQGTFTYNHSDKRALTRSAIFLIFFLVIHAVGNLHVFLGPDDFNGYGYFYVRLYWSGFGLPANIVEEYVLLAAVLHVMVGLKRTWDTKLGLGIRSGHLDLAITGLALLTFMTIHLFQFRFGETQPYKLCPPPYLVNLWTLLHFKLNLFWVDTPGCATSEVRDIYRLEFEVFQSVGWCAFYLLSVAIFAAHMAMGWAKVVPAAAMGIPKGHQKKATAIGYAITAVIALIYASFPIYTHLRPMVDGALSSEPALP